MRKVIASEMITLDGFFAGPSLFAPGISGIRHDPLTPAVAASALVQTSCFWGPDSRLCCAMSFLSYVKLGEFYRIEMPGEEQMNNCLGSRTISFAR